MSTHRSFCISFLLSTSLFSQTVAQDHTETAAIVEEGKRIYRSEMASWFGTDAFLEKYKDQRSNAGGYFSYADDKQTHCVFFTRGDDPEIMATISFDSSFEKSGTTISGERRPFTKKEHDLFVIRKLALQRIQSDTLFKTYDGINLNLVPLIHGNEKKVYVLSGPTHNGVVIFGNDYLLSFDERNELKSVRQLHRNILPVEYGKDQGSGRQAIAGIHSHRPETGDYITSTDIATLMLYQKMAGWEKYYVMSDKFVSIWNCQKNELVTLTREAWDKIYADQPGSKKSSRKRKKSE